MNDFGVIEHADFDRVRTDVLKDAFDLLADQLRRHGLHSGHVKGVLRHDSGNDRHAVFAVRLKGLEVGLNACTAGRVGACNAEQVFHFSVSSSPLPSKAGIKLSPMDSSC